MTWGSADSGFGEIRDNCFYKRKIYVSDAGNFGFLYYEWLGKKGWQILNNLDYQGKKSCSFKVGMGVS